MRSRRLVDTRPAVEQFRDLVEELATQPERRFLTIEVTEPVETWIQVQVEGIPIVNFDYPFDEHPTLKLLLSGVDPPEESTIHQWKAGTSCALYVPTREAVAIAGLMDRLLTELLGCPRGYRFRASFGEFP